jgi:hypothetical protein
MDISEIENFIQTNGPTMDIRDLIKLADLIMLEIQVHKNSAPGWKGTRAEIQENAEELYGTIDWISRETSHQHNEYMKERYEWIKNNPR